MVIVIVILNIIMISPEGQKRLPGGSPVPCSTGAAADLPAEVAEVCIRGLACQKAHNDSPLVRGENATGVR